MIGIYILVSGLLMIVAYSIESRIEDYKRFYNNQGVHLTNALSTNLVLMVIIACILWNSGFGVIERTQEYYMKSDKLTIRTTSHPVGTFMGMKIKGMQTSSFETVYPKVMSETLKLKAEELLLVTLPELENTEKKLPGMMWYYVIMIIVYIAILVSLLYLIRGLFFIKELRKDETLHVLVEHVTSKNFQMKKDFLINPWRSINVDVSSSLNEKASKKLTLKLIKKMN
jgi:hypothetical protein